MFDNDYVVTCTQAADDGCSTDPELGVCPACAYIMHDLPRHTDDAHGELCCGTPICSAAFGDICSTHETFPPQPPMPSCTACGAARANVPCKAHAYLNPLGFELVVEGASL